VKSELISFENYIVSVVSSLEGMKVTDRDSQELRHEEGLSKWCELAEQVKVANATIYFSGNGASAMMASHMAVDFVKNTGIRSLAFNDAAFLTAISNDISYEECFASPLRWFANPEDTLVTISSSGNSFNIIKAIEAARDLQMTVITLSGMSPDNKSRKLGDLNFYIPANTYGIVESSHQVLLHCWFDRFLSECTQ